MDGLYLITEFYEKKTGFLLEDGKLVRACLLSNESLVGNIYTAKVANIVPSINAAFLDAGTGDFLYYSLADNENKHIFLKHGNTDKVCIGDELLVQISMDPIKTKKGVATSLFNFKGKYTVLNRNGVIGVSKKIVDEERKKELKNLVSNIITESSINASSLSAVIRTAAKDASSEDIAADLKKQIELLGKIIETANRSVVKKCIYTHPASYKEELESIVAGGKYENFKIITDDKQELELLSSEINEKYLELYEDKMLSLDRLYNIEDKLTKSFNKLIYLKSGGTIVVEPTEALTVIDVNSGKAVKGKNVQKTFLKTNKEAAKEIARLLRLRNISGIIIIDFISLKEVEDIKDLIGYLKNELTQDEKKVTYVDMTPLGLVELTRIKGEKPYLLSDFIG